MCARLPATAEEFLDVNGVGRQKAQRYGDQFLREIAEFTAEHGGVDRIRPAGSPDGPEKKSKRKRKETVPKQPFRLTAEEAEKFEAAGVCSPGQLAKAMRELTDRPDLEKLYGTAICARLAEEGWLENRGGNFYPTEQGMAAGITAEEKPASRGRPMWPCPLAKRYRSMCCGCIRRTAGLEEPWQAVVKIANLLV